MNKLECRNTVLEIGYEENVHVLYIDGNVD